MKKTIYYSLYDAECAAMSYVMSHPRTEIVRREDGAYKYATIDDRSNAAEDSRFVENVGSWSGEINAIQVRDEATFEIVALFGYWDDEID